ncbi:MAG: serine/threonine-protein kinase [Polyangiales bacterium]
MNPAPANPGDPAPSSDANGTGEVLPRRFGKYTLLRRLAQGGMAELFLALHRSVAGFEKLVVIKRILPEMSKDQAFITMFLQEARIAATFSHPNIVTIFDVGQAEGSYFIAMEHIHGEDLRSIVRSMKPKSVTEFPIEHAIAIVTGVAAGLAYAHDKRDLNGNPLNIVHRDISPQNILVTFTGDVKVVDFGIAKATHDAPRHSTPPEEASSPTHKPTSEHHTKAGQLKGKVPYMSPEQARGELLDARSDIFSVGVILFELCTGRRLFRGKDETETLRMITEGEYPKPSQVNPRISAGLEAVINKALAKDVTQRYQTGRELQQDLETLSRAEGIPVSNLSLGNWMQMLFEERLAAQREALLQGKQLADVLAAEEPQEYTAAGTIGGSLSSFQPQEPPSKAPIFIAAGVALLVALSAGGFVAYREHKRASEEAARAAINSGTLVIQSTPPGASIWVNGGVTQNRTPFTLRGLPTGPNARVVLRITAQGYDPFTQTIPLPRQQMSVNINATLERSRANSYAVLEVNTTPRGAQVIVDGRQIEGATPLSVPELAPGVEHTVIVRHPDAVEETFTFVKGPGELEQRTLTLRERPLAPDEAWVNATVEPGNALMRVGDRTINTGSPYHVRVQANRVLNVVFSAPGYEATARTVRARPGQTFEISAVRLSRPSSSPSVDRTPGQLRIGATPWCNVTVDGRSYGETPVNIGSISPGGHTIVCTNPARGTQTRRVTVSPGRLETIRINF